nr:MAG TPA: hypothetical protein [Caudoviricetes sp.]
MKTILSYEQKTYANVPDRKCHRREIVVVLNRYITQK